jgi:hypothetical protein
MAYDWLPEQYKEVQTADYYKLNPGCIGCEFCKPERLHDDRWVLKCNKKYYGWNNLKCPMGLA